MAGDINKATWANIRAGADEPPADNSDVQESGEASENYKPKHTADEYPDNTANTSGWVIGSDGYIPSYSGNTKTKQNAPGKKKAQAAVQKALQDPDVIKALDTLEEKGLMKALGGLQKSGGSITKEPDPDPDPEPDVDADVTKDYDEDPDPAMDKAYKGIEAVRKSIPTPGDVGRVVKALLAKELEPIQRNLNAIAKAMQSRGAESDLQKMGFVSMGSTPKPSVGAGAQVPSYSKSAPKIQKAAAGEQGEEVPDFDSLAGMKLGDPTMEAE